MFGRGSFRSAIDSLHANVAILDRAGVVLEVNEGWRKYGAKRGAESDYVGWNYLQVCADAARRGDFRAGRVQEGLRRLLKGQAHSFGKAYRCGDRIFRMSARPINYPVGGIIIAHQDITALLQAREIGKQMLQQLDQVHLAHASRIDDANEKLGQKLAGISLAAEALDQGGAIEDAVTLIKLAVEEARQELKLLRYETSKR